MQIISKSVQEKLIRRPLEFFRYERKNRCDGLSGCATQCQSGRSMIEMLGVLAIIGVLSVGGIMGYSKAMFRYKVNKTIEQITYIAGNIRTTFANQGNYDRVGDSAIWKKAHILPDDVWKDGMPLHLWGNGDEIMIGTTKKNSADTQLNKAFYVRFDHLPDDACIELITHDWRTANMGVIAIDSPFLQDWGYVIPPAKIDDAAKICDSLQDGDISEMDFIFDIDTSDSYWKDQIDATTARLSGS